MSTATDALIVWVGYGSIVNLKLNLLRAPQTTYDKRSAYHHYRLVFELIDNKQDW